MDQDIRLGKIAGIPVGINWSIFVIFLLIVWELADLALPTYHPHDATAIYWFVGTVTTVLFFASLLAHEVSHAVVAKRNGIGVRRITFWLFGGVSELEGDALSPGVDARIAAVGPVTSLVLAGVFGVLVALLHHVGGAALWACALGWLAWMNLLLGIFNLIPAAPLDGGRVLRALLWRTSGDRLGAATAAARAGQMFAYALVVLGILEFLAVGIIGLWFAFMGWFLLSAARAEENAVVMRSSLANVYVRDIMSRDPVTFASATTVASLINDQMHRYRFNSYPLTGADGKLEGLATMARIRHVAGSVRATTRLADIACPLSEIPIAAPDESIVSLLQRMQASPDGRAFVIDGDGRLVGIVSPSDIARYVQLCMLQSQGRATHER
jgi:Zn-dependent protease/predicted transcriptional regulator